MYQPRRDSRFDGPDDIIFHIEETNCALGCIHAIDPQPDMPGGGCQILLDIVVGEPVNEIDDRGYEGLYCTKRQTPKAPIDTTGYTNQPSLLDLLDEFDKRAG